MKNSIISLYTAIAMLVSLFSGMPVNKVSASEAAPYIMSYHTTGTSGTSMTYMDDSLHLAYSYDQQNWTALNDNNGILFKKNSGFRASVSNGLQIRDPFLFKKQDGSYVLLATIVSSSGAVSNSNIGVWDTTDLLTYTNERLIKVAASGTARMPQAKYHAENGNYEIRWTNGTASFSNTTTDFATVSAAAAYNGTDYPVAIPVMPNIPSGATAGSVISVTPAELDKLINRLGTPKMPIGTKSLSIQTYEGVAPVMPDTGEVLYSDGTISSNGVTWDAIDPAQYAKEGSFKVKGMINGAPNYVNPLIKNGADPQIYKKDGAYYYTSSYMNAANNNIASFQYDRITLRKAATIQELATATEKEIFHKDATGDTSYHIWAPELHYVNGKWYVYFASGKSTATFDLRMYVIECDSQDPMTGNWSRPVKIAMNDEAFDLDGSLFEHNGELYFIYAFANASKSINSSIRIAKMLDPYTLDAAQVNIATPEYTWEQRRDNVEEAPTVIKKNGKIFLTYSAGSTDSTYAIGMLTAIDSPGTNVLDPASWTKTPYPLMATSAANGQFGPGHNTFVKGEDDIQDVIVYHARANQQYSGVASYNPLYDASRWARVQHVYWHGDGTPYLGIPVPDGNLPGSAVEATIHVIATAGTVFLNENNFTMEAGEMRTIVLKKAHGDGTSDNVTAAAAPTSSASSVATVSKTGVIKAVGEGSSVIALTYEGKTYTANITVLKPITDTDQLLWYKFDEDAGTSAIDSSGNDRNGTYVNTVSWVNGHDGKAISLSGGAASSTTAPYVRIPAGLLNGVNNVTFSAYVKWTASPATNANQWLYGIGSDSNHYMILNMNTGTNTSNLDKLNATIAYAPSGTALNNGWKYEKSAPFSVPHDANAFKHVVVVYSGDTDTSVLYVNGVEVARNTAMTHNPQDFYSAAQTFSGYLGKSFYADAYFAGQIDDFRVYSKAMTGWEVKRLNETANVTAVEQDTAALTLGDLSAVTANLTLPSVGTNGSAITWQSSDPSVIGMNGDVNRPAYAEGNKTVTLTATVKMGSMEDMREFDVTVLKKAGVAAAGVSLNKSSAALRVGDIDTIVATVNPDSANDKTVTFAVDGSAVTVSNAVYNAADGTTSATITAAAKGNAIVMATTADGSFTAQYSVTVDAPDVTVPGESTILATLTGAISVSSEMPFDLTFGLSHVTESLYAQDLTLNYDATKMQFVSVESLKTGLSVVTQVETPGQVRLIAASTGAGNAITMDGQLLKLYFKAKAVNQASTGTINMTSVVVANAAGVETAVNSGTVHNVEIVFVDKAALNAAIMDAQTMHDAAEEGTGKGQYPAGSKVTLQAAIDSAKTITDHHSATQQQVNQAADQLATTVQSFMSSVNLAVKGDLNGDDKVSIGDLAIMAVHYGGTSADPDWHLYKKADMNDDGIIDIVDLAAIAKLI